MKKTLFLLMLGALAIGNTQAQSLLHYWNFNNVSTAVYVPTTSVPATYTMISSPAPYIWYTTVPGTSSAYSSYYDGYTGSDSAVGATQDWNARFGDPAGYALRLRNPSDSMELIAVIPTTAHQNPVIKYVSESSSSAHGMQEQVFDYSTDGGTTWSTAGLSVTSVTPIDTYWTSQTINLSSTTDPAIKNNANLMFRIKFMINNTGTSGNDRIDNFTVEADTFSTTTIVNAVAAVPEFTLYPNPVVNTVELQTSAEGAKAITIRDMAGKTVYAGIVNNTRNAINVSNLPSGEYFITARESATGTSSTMKFIKQ